MKTDSPLVQRGLHLAELIDVRRFANVFGGRVSLVFRISTGRHVGQEIINHVVAIATRKLASCCAVWVDKIHP
jgi:hypothetical protein